MFAHNGQEQAKHKKVLYTQSDTTGASTDFTLWHIFKLTHHGSALVQEWRLISTLALLLMMMLPGRCERALIH